MPLACHTYTSEPSSIIENQTADTRAVAGRCQGRCATPQDRDNLEIIIIPGALHAPPGTASLKLLGVQPHSLGSDRLAKQVE
jgi:hypothetical protein